MKKVLVLCVAMSFFVIGAGTSLADESDSTVSALDTHAVWTQTTDDSNRPGTNQQANMGVPQENFQASSNKEATGTFPVAELEEKYKSSPQETSAIEAD